MNTDNRNQMQENIFIIFILVQAMIINFPFLIIRLFLHYNFRSGASVFAFKNLLVIATNFTEVIRYVCCKEGEKQLASRGHTPSNTEDCPSVIQSNPESSRMGDDTSSVASSTKRTNPKEEQRRSRLLNLQEEEEEEDGAEEIVVLS